MGKLHIWIQSFLSYCSQSVKVSSSIISSSIPVNSGVVQGSMSGPILFSAFITEIVYCFKYGKPILYADDLKVIFSIDSTTPAESHTLILNDLCNLSLWCSNNGLLLNFDKCVVLHYGLNNPHFVYTLDNNQICSVTSTIDLGVQRTNDFTYNAHCNNIICKANRTYDFILRSFTSRNHLFITSSFCYLYLSDSRICQSSMVTY